MDCHVRSAFIYFKRTDRSISCWRKALRHTTTEDGRTLRNAETEGCSKEIPGVKEGGKVVFWDIPDPAGQADDLADDLYRQVQRRVEQLVAKIG